MAGMNTVCITGNLGKDPELRHTAGGTAVLQMNVAVSERRKVNNEWTDYTHWVPCIVFGTRAESLAKFLHKGSKVGISGKLNYSAWKNDKGETRSKLEVVANDVELLTPKNGGSQAHQNAPDDAVAIAEATYGVQMQPVYEDEDLPF